MPKKKFNISRKFYFLVSGYFLVCSCVYAQSAINERDVNFLLSSSAEVISQSQQILLIYEQKNIFSTRYYAYAWQKTENGFKPALKPMKAVIGRNGFAPPGEKREGDGRTPTGIFALKRAFGYEKAVRTKMPYRQVFADDIWVDDPEAPDYNQWVKKDKTNAASFEKMKRDDDQYKYGVVIEYNTSPVVKGHGSAIFLHIWKAKNKPTTGCVAVSENDLLKILYWLDHGARPVIILGNFQEKNR